MNKKFSLARLFDDNRFVTIFALVMAVLLYLVVAMTQQDTTNYTIRDVPIDLSLQEAHLTSLGLNVIEGGEYTVDITISGPRTEVPRYDNPELPELATTANISGLTEPGTHTLSVVSAYPTPEELPFEIVGYSPSTIQVTLDRLQTKTFEIAANVRGVTTPSGYVQDSTAIMPARVTVTGPEAEISQVASAEIVYDSTDPLEQTLSSMLPVVLKDAQGEEIDLDALHLTMDVKEAQLVITVLKEAELPLRLDFLNLPSGFPEEELRSYMQLSNETALIAGPSTVIDPLTEIHLGYIDLKELSPRRSEYDFSLGLDSISDQITSMENIGSVSAVFDASTWETEGFTVSNINLLNVPAEYEVTLVSTELPDVEFVGIDGALDEMTAEDIVAEVDLSERELTVGQQRYPVKISAPGAGLVWALDDHAVYIRVEEKAEE